METLLERLKSGDETAFVEIYNKYFHYMIYIAQKILNDYEMSENIVQEVFVTMWRKKTLHNLNLEKAELRSYITQSIKYASYYAQKKIQKIPNFLELDNFLLNVIAEPEKSNKFKIPDYSFLILSQREAIKAVYVDGLSRKEYAEQKGISINTLNVTLAKAFKKFREKYTREHFLD